MTAIRDISGYSAAIWWHREPDGTYTAKCDRADGWRYRAATLDATAKRRAETSLAAWLLRTFRFQHFTPVDLKEAAA